MRPETNISWSRHLLGRIACWSEVFNVVFKLGRRVYKANQFQLFHPIPHRVVFLNAKYDSSVRDAACRKAQEIHVRCDQNAAKACRSLQMAFVRLAQLP